MSDDVAEHFVVLSNVVIRRCAAVFVVALVASACGGDKPGIGSDTSVSTNSSTAPIGSSDVTGAGDGTSTSVESTVDEVAQVTTIEGNVAVTVSSATSAQPGTRTFAAGQPASMTAVDGDDVFFLTFAPGGLAALNRVSTATGARATSATSWILSGVLPVALTPDNVWTLSPGDAATGGQSRAFTVLDRVTLAVVGQYDSPDGSVPISVVTVGDTAYVLTVATMTPAVNEPFDYRIRSLGADGVYGEPLAVDSPGTMISTGRYLVLTLPGSTGSDQLQIIDPASLALVGEFAVAGIGSIAGMDNTVVVSSGIYDITDPANPVRRDPPADLGSSTLMGHGRLVALDFKVSTSGSLYGIKVFDAASFEQTDDIEGRTPQNIEVYASDGRRLCADMDSPDGSIICVDLDQDSTPRIVVPTTSTVPTTTTIVVAPVPTVAPPTVPRSPSSVPPPSVTWNGQYVDAPFTGPLQIGQHGSRVLALQEALGKAGFLDAKKDGYFGRDTETAVIELQRAKGLAVNGVATKEVAGELGLTGY
ncbi:MAG: peptidoglycan-binding domain-containing protein [Ilumatobacteraceae bacterium]